MRSLISLLVVCLLALFLASDAQARGPRVVVRGGGFGGRSVIVNNGFGGGNVVAVRGGVFGPRVQVFNGGFVQPVGVQSFQSFGGGFVPVGGFGVQSFNSFNSFGGGFGVRGGCIN